ncbi:nicotinate-nucleotide adenylyltransferase [Jeotgalibacillus campisalis]|uniref:Probable nicotinate-nucleotide adenylyltransferase n=1 Tax=Jeotgalibacillus campisalis TaxID=220754 RepID=A0A0C2VAX0_9BACL|nr:nicotinate-nucleotide adenylyltransferase [Jeotgalibacillus campisalis]KIL46067.1 nicotinic acid mononucleotide adenylyltransferase [Jeotgalibacillus campisalis]
MKPKKVGILGGTFNPLHIGHLIMANEAYHELKLDEVRFMPSAKPPHKSRDLQVKDDQRIRMIQLAIEDIEYFKLELIEFERSGLSYTYDTIIQLKDIEPETEFIFLIGGDMIDYLPSWYRIEDLVHQVQFAGFVRPGYEGKTEYPVLMLQSPMIDLSSTLIRDRLNNKKDSTFLLPQKVYDYINMEGLYEL